METKTSVTYAYPPQPQVLTQQTEQQTQVVSVRGSSTCGAEKSIGLGVAEIILRILCLVFCLGALIAASVTIAAINDVDNVARDYHQADSYRGVAIWLTLVGVVAVIYHGVAILLRILYYAVTIGQTFAVYSIANAVLCVLFGMAFFAGAVSNAVYASDNRDLYNTGLCGGYYSYLEVCDDLEIIYQSEAAAASFGFLAMVLFIPLFFILLVGGIKKVQETSNQGNSYFESAPSAPYVNLPNSDY